MNFQAEKRRAQAPYHAMTDFVGAWWFIVCVEDECHAVTVHTSIPLARVPAHVRVLHSARYTTWTSDPARCVVGVLVCAAVGCAATSVHFQMSTVIRLSMRRPAMTPLGRRACSSSSSSSPSAPPRNPNVIPPGMGSGRDGNPIPGEIAGGPKPVVYRSFVLNSKVCASAPTHSDMCLSAMLASRLFRSCKFAFLNRRCLAFYWMLILTLCHVFLPSDGLVLLIPLRRAHWSCIYVDGW